MPSGDAQRVWFLEMLDDLAKAWSPAMTWDQVSDLCRRMTEKRLAIRRSRGIQPPRTRCSCCGEVSQSDISGVSVRSALFALEKLGVVSQEEFKALDGRFKKHRRVTGADAYGRRPAPDKAETSTPGTRP